MADEFWNFSVAAYAAPGVADECLDLQDHFGIDVNVLLFCTYMGVKGLILTDDEIGAARALVDKWQAAIVQPLRGARRWLKADGQTSDSRDAGYRTGAETLRKQISALELEAEHIEQRLLDHWASERWTSNGKADVQAAVTTNIESLLRSYAARTILPQKLIATVSPSRIF